MKNLVKFTTGVATLALFGNASAETVNMSVGLTALVASSCNTEDAFVSSVDLSTQINDVGGIKSAVGIPITNGANIICNVTIRRTTLNMVSTNRGIKNGSVILPYKITGDFGQNVSKEVITINPFDSGVGPATDLLNASDTANGPGATPAGTPNLLVTLNDQPDETAIAGNYADTLTLTVVTTP